jgi:RNA polymerase sigma factor FliA
MTDHSPPPGSAADQPTSSGVVVPALVDEDLVMKALPLIDGCARKLYSQLGGKLPLDDLRSIGHFAAMGIVRDYDPQRSPFVPYVRQRMRWAMLDGIRKQTHGRAMAARARALSDSSRFGLGGAEGRTGAVPSSAMPPSEGTFGQRFQQVLRQHAAVMGIRLMTDKGRSAAVTPSSANPERATLQLAALEAVRGAVDSIEDERLRDIVERHYFAGESITDIARSMGLSTPWVSRLHAQAIGLLEKRLRARGLSSKR